MNAFAEIYVRFRTDVHRCVRRILVDAHDADEATQQTFAQALAALDSFDSHRGEFRGWLIRIAQNHAYDVLRRRMRFRAADIESDDELEVRLGPAAATDFLADDAFRTLLCCLSPEQRAVIVLRYQFGWGISEIAAQLRITPNAAAQTHRRALQRLRTSGSEVAA